MFNRKSQSLLLGVVTLVGLSVLLPVRGCFFSRSDSNFSPGTTSTTATTVYEITTTVNQSVTPELPEAVNSTCGHSKYYYATNLPGVGIVGGIEALANQYPWMARLVIRVVGSSSLYVCDGAIISKSHILTAAHCINGITISSITVYLGDHNTAATDSGERSVLASTWTKHASFNANTMDYDFALLKLSTNLTFTSWNIQPICLPTSCDTGCTNVGSIVYIAGWGLTSSGGSASQYLRTAYIQIGNFDDCKAYYSLTDRMICAGYWSGGVDSCQGDSGGPLMSNEDGYFKLCGVTSFGKSCGLANYLGVYSKACSVLTWIKSNAGL